MLNCTVIAVIGEVLLALCQEVPEKAPPQAPPAQEKQAPVPDTPKIPPGKRINV